MKLFSDAWILIDSSFEFQILNFKESDFQIVCSEAWNVHTMRRTVFENALTSNRLSVSFRLETFESSDIKNPPAYRVFRQSPPPHRRRTSSQCWQTLFIDHQWRAGETKQRWPCADIWKAKNNVYYTFRWPSRGRLRQTISVCDLRLCNLNLARRRDQNKSMNTMEIMAIEIDAEIKLRTCTVASLVGFLGSGCGRSNRKELSSTESFERFAGYFHERRRILLWFLESPRTYWSPIIGQQSLTFSINK